MRAKLVAAPKVEVPPDTITLEGISLADARVIVRLMEFVGGEPGGPRGAADRLQQALRAVVGEVPGSDYRVTDGNTGSADVSIYINEAYA